MGGGLGRLAVAFVVGPGQGGEVAGLQAALATEGDQPLAQRDGRALDDAPTTMQVRDATVGPLSGARSVVGTMTLTPSAGMPRASAAICVKMVKVP